MLKRLFDIFCAFFGLIFLLPIFVIVSIAIILDSPGGVFFKQLRVGRFGKDFFLFKFRTMEVGSDKIGLLTVGGKDCRVTRIGYHLRKYKIDELPQLLNVLSGSMSLVGPRPEVRKYVDLYNESQQTVLNLKPGMTDMASIMYRNENELLAGAKDPEEYYVRYIMPDKIRINLLYKNDVNTVFGSIRVIFKTIFAIIRT